MSNGRRCPAPWPADPARASAPALGPALALDHRLQPGHPVACRLPAGVGVLSWSPGASPAIGYDPRNFTAPCLACSARSASASSSSVDVGLGVDHEAVVAEPAVLGRPADSRLDRLIRRAANSWRIEIRLPGSSARWYTTIAVRSWPVRRRHAVAGDDDEPGLVAGVVGDVGRPAPRARSGLGRDPRRDGRHARLGSGLAVALGDEPGRLGRASWPGAPRRARSCSRRKRWHCAVATGIDSTAFTCVERQAAARRRGSARCRARSRR